MALSPAGLLSCVLLSNGGGWGRSFSSVRPVAALSFRGSAHLTTFLGQARLPQLSSGLSRLFSSSASPAAADGDKEGGGGYDYDLAVIGGGSGGMAAAKEAARLGAKVVLFDYVKPSTQGTKWGLGGTCVNVGCVPKKLMHYAGLMGPILHHDAQKFGWKLAPDASHDWGKLVETVQNHIRQLNFSYRSGLRGTGVNYLNALATFQGPNEIAYTQKGEEKTLSAKNILIATGGRPNLPSDIPGARELAITSDDIFSMKKSPGKTLVVGGAYIALETAGFLTELGYDVSVSFRSILLRGFDRQCAEKIGNTMRLLGTKFLPAGTLPSKMEKEGDGGKIRVHFKGKDGETSEEVYDTVLYATGRTADLAGLSLGNAGVVADPSSGKLDVDDGEATNVPNIFAVGDILKGRPELTPVAIRAGELLARRLFAGSTEKMNWDLIATTVFTPAEYGSVGLSEEEAVKRWGRDDIETYLLEFTSLEMAAAHRQKDPSLRADDFDVDIGANALSKLVVRRSEDEKVVGFHYVGPNAGEITQGFAVAMRLGAKKRDLDGTIGIHPTDAESLVQLDITGSSGESYLAAGGCGGGKCG
uniref:Thioredoxin reductase n=1 Tax=Chromera velia CCMP2878 TaxID=1169474 RepID=A0A0G4FIK1_9ALVE|eukprot:Cvel_17217.t1-p1 / transcript=Cvel_17217.t1 / gene=Cvel_17217 / organism=Chromera_velia_CCMP2878 / gene_product=Thioredoxin reductase, putative / transcript_product=Thioredoxin reductase, putative / location=Cvel_scaffold1362:32284-36150(-) / protein_length=586 / sequence_SO=supercontig / SO=protein_coding / is_pseudo=false